MRATHAPEKITATTLLLAASACSPNRPRPTSLSNRPRQSSKLRRSDRVTSSSPRQAQGSDLAKADNLEATLQAYLNGKPLAAGQQDEINRLLGLYTRIKYGRLPLKTLRNWWLFQPTTSRIKALADSFGWRSAHIDNRVYEISLGSGKEVIGIHAHADVVPVNPDNWKLDDGTRLDPFKVTLVGDRMYGRGTEDDKNGIVVAMYALKVAKDENLPLARQFKLLIDTTEETSGDAIPIIRAHPTPDYTWRWMAATRRAGHNQIPTTSVATLATETGSTRNQLQRAGAGYVKQHGGDFSIDAKADGKQVVLTVTGVSRIPRSRSPGRYRSSTPIHRRRPLRCRQLGLDYLGNKLGVAFKDPFMGPLTASLTYVGASRLPRSRTNWPPDWTNGPGRAALGSLRYSLDEPMYRNPEGEWVKALLAVASENLGMKHEFGTSAGATSVHDLPHGVQFGLAMPDVKYTGHNDNEFRV
uniref:Uncharacterized protein n=1 Tax=Ditylenchus dipsaci TaxID=166011 RepID=A0A915DRH4_9BILA